MRLTPARLLPALSVAAWCSLAAIPGRDPRLGPAPPLAVGAVNCDNVVATAPGDSQFVYGTGSGVVQPFPDGVTVAACSLYTQAYGWSELRLSLQDWDPLTLTPDAHTVALRVQYLDPSALNYYTENRAPFVAFVPPAVSASVAGVAEPPRTTIAAAMEGVYNFGAGGLTARYEADGDPSLPEARRLVAGAPQPLPGAHAVLAGARCDGGAELAPLRVAQAVTRTDALVAPERRELLQYFRVPERVELHWVELGVERGAWHYGLGDPSVGIVDAASGVDPSAGVPAPLIESTFRGWSSVGTSYSEWATVTTFDHTLVLEPDHDYALLVRNIHDEVHWVRVADGLESPVFTGRIGALWARDTSAVAWEPESGRALTFKLIGVSSPPVSGPPFVQPPAFALTVAPNPVRDAADVSWSGAVGPVRLEVLDARGRRVATSSGGAAGLWHWGLVRSDGRELAAGVYFLHVRDSQGQRTAQRVVVLR